MKIILNNQTNKYTKEKFFQTIAKLKDDEGIYYKFKDSEYSSVIYRVLEDCYIDFYEGHLFPKAYDGLDELKKEVNYWPFFKTFEVVKVKDITIQLK